MINRRAMLQGVLGAGATGGMLLADANRQAKAQDNTPIPVGSALPMSGISAADGIEFKNGLDLAAEEINAAGGILGRPIEIHIEDTKEMGADLVSQAMQRLVDRFNTPVIINGYCRAMGYKRADYRPLFNESTTATKGKGRWQKS